MKGNAQKVYKKHCSLSYCSFSAVILRKTLTFAILSLCTFLQEVVDLIYSVAKTLRAFLILVISFLEDYADDAGDIFYDKKKTLYIFDTAKDN